MRNTLTALAALALVGCQSAAAQTVLNQQRSATAVRTAAAEAASLDEVTELLATVTAARRASLSVLAAGRVDAVLVDRGQRVRAGDPLVRVRESDPRRQIVAAAAALEAARARATEHPDHAPEVAAARAQLATADDALARVERLSAVGSASTQDLVRARNDRDAAAAQLSAAMAGARSMRASARQAAAGLAQSRQGLDDATLRAPFDGVVAERAAEPGEWVSPDRPVIQLVANEALRVRLELPQHLAAQAPAGARISVWTDPAGARSFDATVTWVSPALDAATRTRVVEASLPDRTGLLPGTRVLARVPAGDPRPAARVPLSALTGDGPAATVFVVRDGRAEARVAWVALRRGDSALIARGVEAGERVVLAPPPSLRDGAAVSP